jgi:molybdenum cofactor cytidylyltransferase
MSVAAIILAAGASSRLGRPKQLVEFRGETLVARAIRLALEAGAEPVIAVLGAEYETIRAAIASTRAQTIRNENWEQGIAGSVHAGLRVVAESAPDAAGAMILTCDQPRLTAEHLRALLVAFAALREPGIVASNYASVRGVPAIFPREVFPELYALEGDRGARALLARPSVPVVARDFDGGEIDIDTPTDLAGIE